MIGLPWILAHFIGDYLLQNDWMALGKKRSSLVCTVHVTLYILPFFLTELTLLQIVLVYAQHWLQDRTRFIGWWCRTMGSFQLELRKDSLPWGHFIVDNVFHVIWVWLVITYI